VTSNTDITICNAQLPYSWNGNSYNAAGSYNVTLVSASGCDSIATLNLVVNNAVTSTTNIIICPAQLPYSWNANTYNAAGAYNVTLASATGCDSVATLNLTVNAVVTSTTNIAICTAQLPYSWNGNSYNAAGSYSVTLSNVAGCDSIATLNLAVNNAVTSITNIAICNALLPYSWNGNNYNAAGSYNVTLVSAAGCDSIATLNLAVNNPTSSTTNVSVCAAALPYVWNGNNYNNTGSYNATLVNAAGCDSIATLNLTVLNATSSVTNARVCAASLPYTWNGNSYNAAGSYVFHTTNAAGCDSAATLVLDVLNATSSVATSVSVCASSLPYVWNGNSYNATGIYTYHTTNAAGCDSTATLNLTVNIVATSITDIAICNSQLPYLWNDNRYTQAGEYTVLLTSASGCDSIATLKLTSVTPVTQNNNLTGCSSVTFNGTLYTSSNTVQQTIQSAGGCDSVYVVTNITITHATFDLSIAATPNPAREGDVVQFITSSSTPYNVTAWEPADVFTLQNGISQQIVADSNMQISVTAVSANGCLATAYYSFKVQEPIDFWVPNAFTPNEDGDNDFFSAYGTTIKKGLLRIYNQWGQLIFETADIKKGWDGKFKGVPQPVGVYAYVVFAEMFNGSSVTDKGFLNLIR
jgi:gliding motility-associated-like protein